MQGKSLFDHHIHLGLGSRAVAQPEFTGGMWRRCPTKTRSARSVSQPSFVKI